MPPGRTVYCMLPAVEKAPHHSADWVARSLTTMSPIGTAAGAHGELGARALTHRPPLTARQQQAASCKGALRRGCGQLGSSSGAVQCRKGMQALSPSRPPTDAECEACPQDARHAADTPHLPHARNMQTGLFHNLMTWQQLKRRRKSSDWATGDGAEAYRGFEAGYCAAAGEGEGARRGWRCAGGRMPGSHHRAWQGTQRPRRGRTGWATTAP